MWHASTSHRRLLDLADVREQVRLTLRRMDHEDVAMEYDVAEDIRPVEKCLQDVESCDVYILLLAWRYGHIPKGYDLSITHLEFRRAVETNRHRPGVPPGRGGAVARQSIREVGNGQGRRFRAEAGQRLVAKFTSARTSAPGSPRPSSVEQEGEKGHRCRPHGLGGISKAVFEQRRWVLLSTIAGARNEAVSGSR